MNDHQPLGANYSPTSSLRPLTGSAMKILHALVGYLTVTGPSLPFHPLAFASPLAAIDYDGYVNTTQNHIDDALMKHVLGTIVETCQTITTQNHKDHSALMKRAPGDIIEARQWETPAVIAVAVLIADVFLGIIWIEEDDAVRGNAVLYFVDYFD